MLKEYQKELLELCWSLEVKNYLSLDIMASARGHYFFDVLPKKEVYMEISSAGNLFWRDLGHNKRHPSLTLEEFLEAIPSDLKKIFLYNLDLFRNDS